LIKTQNPEGKNRNNIQISEVKEEKSIPMSKKPIAKDLG